MSRSRSLRDFNYNNSDIILALIILAIAAALIFWRIDIIMAYPKTIETQATATEQTDVSDGVENVNDNQETTVTTGKIKATWSGDVLAEELTTEITGKKLADREQSLVDIGLFTSTIDFEDTCKAENIDFKKLAAGKYVFMEGMTKKDIAKMVTKSE